MILYGAIFSKKQIDGYCSQVDIAENLLLNNNTSCFSMFLTKLKNFDDRFTFKNKISATASYYIIGIPLDSAKDQETFLSFKKRVSGILQEITKKEVVCNFYN